MGNPRGGWEYARTGNPTRARLEAAVAELEGGTHGLAFASGSATTQAIATLALPGEQIVCVNDVYGGTFRLFERVLHDMGVRPRTSRLAGNEKRPSMRCSTHPRASCGWRHPPIRTCA